MYKYEHLFSFSLWICLQFLLYKNYCIKYHSTIISDALLCVLFSNPSQYISPTHRIDLHSNFSTCSLTAKNYLYVGHILTEKDIELWCFILHPVYKNKQTRKTKTKTCPNSCSLWGSHLTLIWPIRLYLLINVFFSSIFFSDLTHL